MAGHITGDVDIHDVHIRSDGQPVFVVTRFNCIATLAERGSFKVLWKPDFIDKIAAEDRCHLNGLALDGDVLRYTTCVGKSNVSDGWRDHRAGGGLLIDLADNEIITDSLSMPQLHQGKLWLIQSGTGEFGHVDTDTGAFEAVCFNPGFGRGPAFIGEYAVIGMSLPRDNRSFNGLPLNERLEREGAAPKCGLAVINLKTGDLEHQFILEGVVQELYDVAVIPGVVRPGGRGRVAGADDRQLSGPRDHRTRPADFRYARDPVVALCLVAVLLGGVGFAVWAATAQLAQGISAAGTLIVEDRRRIVQHLEGGIIKASTFRKGSACAQATWRWSSRTPPPPPGFRRPASNRRASPPRWTGWPRNWRAMRC